MTRGDDAAAPRHPRRRARAPRRPRHRPRRPYGSAWSASARCRRTGPRWSCRRSACSRLHRCQRRCQRRNQRPASAWRSSPA
ncbi:hypothetical protein DF200_09055 [Bifidobacterium catulorum]|uniref:Uncharacterized protein n=1 Tax=Bifidobacterium catulorum TaxID=1630173 RepID=A0A2U2MQN6_9BIFI|nr:hypothetical protein DF200_09055 [Bifidobacterium catulorum]